ncbi:hypothetical protein BCR34DRAFT_607493 [Clohesyomyces aquaticus]|uniref:Uncharacterized protein n=1 Tax=Clohesyomyces aquaticus TaxID=1231657 RepID=A0A1Y1YFV7_9PLEO|nr:hypothetical protein BCR34DRAFT_607493 [Clohesyomyces aquaticus]
MVANLTNSSVEDASVGQILLVHDQAEVDKFWKSTDDETRRIVKEAAQSENLKQLDRSVRGRVTSKEKRYIREGSTHAELESMLQAEIDKAATAQTNVKHGKSKRVRVEQQTTKFLDRFHGYVQAYSGVVQIMNGAGQGYGDAAYGALSLFLVVAVNKKKTEDVIEKMLVTLQQQYCRIQMIKEVYATSRMKEHTAVVYRLGIEFLYEAVRYYSVSPSRRLLYVISRPPSIDLDNKVSEIHDAIEEMRKEMEALDGIRLNNVEQELGKVAETVDTLRIRSDNDRLDVLRALLKVDPRDSDISLEGYQKLLDRDFEGLPRLPAFDVDRQLFDDPEFRRWINAPPPALMVLHGSTVAPAQTQLAWVSPGAMRLVTDIENIAKLEGPRVVYQFCRHTDEYDTEKVSPCVILSRILYQLLRLPDGKHILRNEALYGSLKQRIEDLETISPKRVSERLEKLYAMLEKVLSELGPGSIFVVIDRTDQIAGDFEDFMAPLLDMMSNPSCKLKVFMTRRVQYSFDDSAIKETLSRGRYYGLRVDQDGM